jgi:hypothetical protein
MGFIAATPWGCCQPCAMHGALPAPDSNQGANDFVLKKRTAPKSGGGLMEHSTTAWSSFALPARLCRNFLPRFVVSRRNGSPESPEKFRARPAARTNEPPTEAGAFSIGGYHRGFWASKELSGVRAAMTNLCSRFVDPSNQSQTTQSPSTAVTVITGPPELRRTVSPGLKGIFDSPAAS